MGFAAGEVMYSLRDEQDDRVRLIITHMDDSQTEIVFSDDDEDAYTWDYNSRHLRVKRHGGRTCFPWPTVKSYTVIYRLESAIRRDTVRAMDLSNVVQQFKDHTARVPGEWLPDETPTDDEH
jgi:hypothetical protein